MVKDHHFGTRGVLNDVVYRVTGAASGPTLVVGNSLGTDSRLWNAQVEQWAADFRVIGFEYPGHGSGEWAGEQTMAAYARRLASVLDTLNVTEYSYCGLSMGGAIGMELALLHRDGMKKLVLSNTAAEFGKPEFWTSRGEKALGGGLADLAELTLGRWFTTQFAMENADVVNFAKAMLLNVEPAGYAACCRAIGAFDFQAQLKQITQPTLVISGAYDSATTPAQAAFLADEIPNSTRLELEAAHLGNLGAPDQFSTAVHSFLSST